MWGRAHGYHCCCRREVPRDSDAPILFLQALSALCHPPHHPLPFWGHPLHLLPSRGTLCAEPCPVPPCSQQRVGVWQLHLAGARGIPWGRNTARGLPCSQPGLGPVAALGLDPWWHGARTHDSAGLGPTATRGSGAGLRARQVPGIPLAPVGGHGLKPAKRREKQMRLFPFSRDNCLPNCCCNYCPREEAEGEESSAGRDQESQTWGGVWGKVPRPTCAPLQLFPTLPKLQDGDPRSAPSTGHGKA